MVGFGLEGGLAGDLMAAGMTLLMAAMMVIARRQGDIPVMPAACLSGLISALAALPFATLSAVGAGDILPLILFGLVNAAAGLALFTLGARRLPAVETALIGSLDAPLAPIVGVARLQRNAKPRHADRRPHRVRRRRTSHRRGELLHAPPAPG